VRYVRLQNLGQAASLEIVCGLTFVGASCRAQRFAVHVAPFDRLALLMQGELRLASEFDALGLCIGAAPCGAFLDAAIFQLRRYAKDRENDLGKIRRVPSTWRQVLNFKQLA